MIATRPRPVSVDGDDLPEGWAYSTAGQIGDVIGGGTPDTKDPDNFAEKGHPWVTPADLSGFTGIYITRGKRCLSEKGLRSSSAVMMPKGSVLLSSRAPIGYVAIAANAISTNQGFKSFVLPDGIEPEFVFFWLKFIKPELQSMGSGSTFSEISGSRAQEIPLKLAPLTEQKRLVGKAKRLLARINVCRDRLNPIPAILKRFRQAVLAAACSGQLTADWRKLAKTTATPDQLYDRAQEVRMDRYQQECSDALKQGRRKPSDPRKAARSGKPVIDLPDIPEEWGLYALQDLCYLVTDGTHKTPNYIEEGIPFLSVKNVRPFLLLDKDVKRISLKEHHEINTRCNPEIGDILYTKVGATFGFAAVNKLEYPFSLFVSVALLKPIKECLTSEYAEILLNSEFVYAQARDRVSGSGTPDLHLIEIRDFRIPLPGIEEQREIVHRVKDLFKLADAIEKRVASATARVEKLTQVVLAKAFRGELVPTEAELARREDRSYETASELLVRIRAAKAVSSNNVTRSKHRKREVR